MKIFKSVHLYGLSLLCLLLLPSFANAKEDAQSGQRWQRIAVVAFTIEPQILDGSPERADQDAILKKLSIEAGKRAERLLLKRHVAATVEQVASIQATTAPVFVTGTVSLPISLPPGVIGWRALTRKGTFVTTRIYLVDAAGKTLMQQTVTLDWGDVWWLHGGIRKRNAKLDDVLVKFVRKSVDRAMEQMLAELSKGNKA